VERSGEGVAREIQRAVGRGQVERAPTAVVGRDRAQRVGAGVEHQRDGLAGFRLVRGAIVGADHQEVALHHRFAELEDVTVARRRGE
jgi:hypothetical protein